MIKVADEIWLATSLLHVENPERPDFSVIEIVERVMSEAVENLSNSAFEKPSTLRNTSRRILRPSPAAVREASSPTRIVQQPLSSEISSMITPTWIM